VKQRKEISIKRLSTISAMLLMGLVSFQSASAAVRMSACYDSEADARAWAEDKVVETEAFYKNVSEIRELAENPDTSLEDLIDRFGEPNKKIIEHYVALSWFPPEATSFELINKFNIRMINDQYCIDAGVGNLNVQIYITVDVHGEILFRQYIGETAL